MLDQLQADLKQAMLARDKVRVGVIQALKTALRNESISNSGEISAQQEVAVLRREVKKRQEAASMYAQANREEQAKLEQDEQEIIQGYLPKQLTEEQLVTIIQNKMAAMGNVGQQDMGRVMGVMTKELGDSADNGIVAGIVRDLLSKQEAA